jgi:hypothetical protein
VLAKDLYSNDCDRVRDVSGAWERRRSRGRSIVKCKASGGVKGRNDYRSEAQLVLQSWKGNNLDAL